MHSSFRSPSREALSTGSSGSEGTLTRSEPDLGPDLAVGAKHLVLSITAFESGEELPTCASLWMKYTPSFNLILDVPYKASDLSKTAAKPKISMQNDTPKLRRS